jgi:hypothetical protein
MVAGLAVATGALVLLPACGGSETTPPAEDAAGSPTETTEAGSGSAPAADPLEVPTTPPAGWDPIAFNKERGNAGAIPEGYLDDVNGPDGELKHLGKHLPYVPKVDAALVPEGYLALMWGDPDKGHAMHPNAQVGAEAYPKGHFYDWVRVRKAVADEADEVETRFAGWPEPGEAASGRYAVLGGGGITDNGGKNTIYLVKLPADVKPGDAVRIHAHCHYHGEYVDFLAL